MESIMKNWLLLGTTVPALMLFGGVANAQDFKVTISGEAKFEAYFSSQKKDQNTRNVDFRNRFRVSVNPEATALNGALTYGANVMLKNEDSNSKTSFEANYIYLKGAFGTVYLGDKTTYDDDVGITKPQDFISENDGQLAYVNSSNDPAYGTGILGHEAWREQTIQLGGQATRVRYDSPFISGLQLSASYTPQSKDDAWSFGRSKTTDTQDAFAVDLKFDSTDKTISDRFGQAILKASFSFASATDKTTAVGGQSFEDPRAYKGALAVGYGGFQAGGYYVDFGKSNLWKGDATRTRHYDYGLGGQYTTGPWVFGIGYQYAQKDTGLGNGAVSTDGKKTMSSITGGVKYTVAKGLDAFADYSYVRTKNSETGANNERDNANVVILGTTLAF
jgi:outer membrane protein OmpU